MSAKTTADEHMQRAREHIEGVRREVGAVLLERKTMWGAADFAPGYVRNVFDRLEALSRAIDGEDVEGNIRSDAIGGP